MCRDVILVGPDGVRLRGFYRSKDLIADSPSFTAHPTWVNIQSAPTPCPLERVKPTDDGHNGGKRDIGGGCVRVVLV